MEESMYTGIYRYVCIRIVATKHNLMYVHNSDFLMLTLVIIRVYNCSVYLSC